MQCNRGVVLSAAIMLALGTGVGVGCGDGDSSSANDTNTNHAVACDLDCGPQALCDPAIEACVCIPGYQGDSTACTPEPVADPATRSRQDVCEAWLADRSGVAIGWNTNGDPCDAGTLSYEAQVTALGHVESYRRLSGVGPVEIIAEAAAEQQECALLMHANGNISHSPPPEWRCYTEAGSAAAGTSLIAWGFASAASTVDAYVKETISGLPHRRNVLSVGRAGVFFGHAGSGGCMRYGGAYAPLDSDPEYVYQPNPGYAPIAVFSSQWSVQPGTGGSATFTARIFRESDNEELPVDQLSSGSALSAWQPDGWTVQIDESYRVVLAGDVGTREYTTTPILCP